MVGVLFEDVDLQFDLFLLVLSDVHDLDGRQLTSFGVAAFVNLAICAIAHDLNKIENSRRILQQTEQVSILSWKRLGNRVSSRCAFDLRSAAT